jgi:hypothetical protein
MGFLPLADDNRRRFRPPVVVGTLVALNFGVWIVQLLLGESATIGYATVPYEIANNVDLTQRAPLALQAIAINGELHAVPQYPGPTPIHLTLLTSMFMHGSWMHLLGNLLYLWIFGDQIEDLLGRGKFIVFYVLCGLIAALAQVMVEPRCDRWRAGCLLDEVPRQWRARAAGHLVGGHAGDRGARWLDRTADSRADEFTRRPECRWGGLRRPHRWIRCRSRPGVRLQRPAQNLSAGVNR